MILELNFSEYLHIYHIERYKHRLLIEDEPLFYFAIAVRKNTDVPLKFPESKGIVAHMQLRERLTGSG